MAKAITTIRQSLHYHPQHADSFAANHALFNRVVAFYFEVIQAHEHVLDLSTQAALTALETLTHATSKNPAPVMPLTEMAQDVPALFRRAAIHAALGSARSFSSSLTQWRARRAKAEAKPARKGKRKQFTERPPVPPRTWNKSVPFYAGQWKERTDSSVILKVWTGTCWSWIKVRTFGRGLPNGVEMGSPSLVRRGKQWWLHTPLEKTFSSPARIEQQVRTNAHTRICAVDLNLDTHLAVCTVQTVEGTILATRFIGHGREIAGFRKQLLGRIARNRAQTGIIAENEQDNADLWRKIRNADEQIAHLVSAHIVQFAAEQRASILVFEHLGNLKPEKGKYSRRGNRKRAFWMKGRIFNFAKYKAWNRGIITSRVNPRHTSRECHRCHALIVRYAAGQPVSGYTPGTPLCLCPQCHMRGNADRNASLVIGQRLIERSERSPAKEKPHALVRRAQGVEKSTGVALSQDAKREEKPSISQARPGDGNAHGTAPGARRRMGTPPPSIPTQLRLFSE
jgi:IS605 OrfB family transposase